MTYMLDTDTVSLIIRKNPAVIKNLIRHEDDVICISAISYAEIYYGLEKKGSNKLFNEVSSFLGKLSIIDFDASQSEIYGRIRARLDRPGTPLGDMDILIAAAALSAGAILISHNTRYFSKIKGIKLDDWSTDR